jgi:carbamoyltransferase
MTNDKFHALFGGRRASRRRSSTQRYMDLAASIQKVTEEVMLRTARHAHKVTGKKNLCLAGGVALNCVGNGKILREGPFEKIWIQPAAGDAGGALGAALFLWHHLLGKPRTAQPADSSAAACSARATKSRRDRARSSRSSGAKYEEYADETRTGSATASPS